ncbi:MAG: sialate O-acetylesterase [Lachnospiraceae bacterium]|nr:sialate O-acetylesterase [Lachnospiraceae bacterium]
MEGQLRLPRLFGSGCVLQQGSGTRIWGWDMPGSKVTISVTSETEFCQSQGTADGAGVFEIMFSGLKAGGPYTLEVMDEHGQQIRIEPVYVGEVYVCGGQSNMELPMCRVRERYSEEFCHGGAPQVHLYKVKEHYEFHAPLTDHREAAWNPCTADKLEEISAFSYFFGKKLQEHLNVPVGIINLSLGGTPIEAWMSQQGIKDWPQAQKLREHYLDASVCRRETLAHEKAEQQWQQEIVKQERQFQKEEDKKKKLWNSIYLPGKLDQAEGLKNFCGSVWLRRSFLVSGKRAGSWGLLRFGTLVDSDQIYINGVLIGETGYCYPPRRYPIPEGLLREGENEIRIRLVVRNAGGRLTENKPYEICWEDPTRPDCLEKKEADERILLEGRWEYQVRAVCDPAPEQLFLNRVPTGLFHAMAAPCFPYQVQGVIWYQGESNDVNPQSYEKLLKAMIGDWRKHWQQDRLPFVIVQLPNCGIDIAPGDAWPVLREGQRLAQNLDDVAVTVTIDLGEDNDLHPLNKKDAANRAVLAVQALVYRETVVSHGPEVQGWQVEHGQVKLTFETGDQRDLILCKAETGKSQREAVLSTVVGSEVPGMEIAGADQKFYKADAKLSKRVIFLKSEKVDRPVYVRYAWNCAPGQVLLYNQSGLPASPFSVQLL